MKIVVVGGYSVSLIKFRGQLLEKMVESGNEVIAMAGDFDGVVASELHQRKIKYEVYPLSRTGLNPIEDVKTFLFLRAYFKKEMPDLVLSYTIKPVIWASIAAKFVRIRHVFGMVTGLGNQLNTHTLKQKALSKVVSILYRYAFSCCESVIFQNGDDLNRLLAQGLIEEGNSHIVNGSGVNLAEYPLNSMPVHSPVFLTVARFLIAKGVLEFAEAARVIRKSRPEVSFRVVGFPESGVNAIPVAELVALHDEGVIELVGKVDNVYAELQQCHIYVLASFYGEGLPRTILEALSVGRPILTTDNVGCRETVEHNVNGVIVKPQSVESLVRGMEWFLENTSRWDSMARASRKLAEDKYDVIKVNKHMFQILGLEPS